MPVPPPGLNDPWFTIGDWLMLCTGFMTILDNNPVAPIDLVVDTPPAPLVLEVGTPDCPLDLVVDPQPISLTVVME
jgi:hypothetical protein